eukprot:jgi/Bigna1/42722/e_gw1.67.51.1
MISLSFCAFAGELDKIYETIALVEKKDGIKVDVLVCCGDFQAVRNPDDLACMACPVKYREMNTFYKYFSGQKKAPVLTLYVAGNHEASNYHMELFHGGWVAPNIYYMGHANVLNVCGIRIAGLSGIYKRNHFHQGFHEKLPLNDGTMRSIYHVRETDVFRLLQVAEPIDVFISHDWPQRIYHYGNVQHLIRRKRHFEREIADNSLGNPAHTKLLNILKPKYWFSAHLHVKFPAIVRHKSGGTTRFLALGKCLPRHDFLQVMLCAVQ